MTGSTRNEPACICAVVLCILLSSTSMVHAQRGGSGVDHQEAISKLPEQEQARFGESLNKAQRSFEQGEFERAITQLTEAYAIYPLPRILYKLAEAEERAGSLEEALEHYQSYLNQGDVAAEERVTIQGLINNLNRRITEPALLILTSTPSGALVYLNTQTEPVGATPLRYPLKPGTYSVRLESSRHEAMTFSVEAKYGSELVLDKKLEELPEDPIEQDPIKQDPIKQDPPDPVTPPPMTPLARPIGLLSAGLGVTGGVLFALASRQANALDSSYEERASVARPEDLDATTNRHNRLVVTAWTLSALSLVGSSWSVLRWQKEREHTMKIEASPQGASLHMEVKF